MIEELTASKRYECENINDFLILLKECRERTDNIVIFDYIADLNVLVEIDNNRYHVVTFYIHRTKISDYCKQYGLSWFDFRGIIYGPEQATKDMFARKLSSAKTKFENSFYSLWHNGSKNDKKELFSLLNEFKNKLNEFK